MNKNIAHPMTDNNHGNYILLLKQIHNDPPELMMVLN